MTEFVVTSLIANQHLNLLTRFPVLAACFARALRRLAALFERRAQGRPGAGRHPGSVRDKNAHGVDHRCAGRPAFPARMVLTVSFVLSPGSDALLPPSPHR